MSNFVDEGKYYDVITSSIQFLGGLIHGIMSDGQLSNTEIKSLNLWLKSNDFLQGTYPFDELTAMLHAILKDGIITEDERNSLLAFMSNLILEIGVSVENHETALSLEVAHKLRNAILRRNCYVEMDVIRKGCCFDDLYSFSGT